MVLTEENWSPWGGEKKTVPVQFWPEREEYRSPQIVILMLSSKVHCHLKHCYLDCIPTGYRLELLSWTLSKIFSNHYLHSKGVPLPFLHILSITDPSF